MFVQRGGSRTIRGPIWLAWVAMIAVGCSPPSDSGPGERRAPEDGGAEAGVDAGSDGGGQPDDGLDAAMDDADVEPGDAELGDDGVDPDGGPPPEECGPPPPITDCTGVAFRPCEPRPGQNGAALLRGTVISGDAVVCDGEVLVDRSTGLIECVGEDCAGHPAASEAAVICADVVLPGLIDPHNHMSYNTLPRWRHREHFRHRDDWRGPLGDDMYDARPTRRSSAARYAELRLLFAGTTSVHKAEDNRASHGLVRNLDRDEDAHGLPYGHDDFTECVFPLVGSCDDHPGVRTPARRYVAHVAEGTNERARAEFDAFVTDGQLGPKTTIVHCTACGPDEFTRMRAAGAALVWSPQSNLDLYGQTTDVATAVNMGVTVALGPDWTPSGTMSPLAELKCAQAVSDEYLGGRLDDRTLVRMATDRAAAAMGVDDLIGRLEPGMRADVLALTGVDRTTPYRAVIGAEATAVAAVFIDGVAWYGDAAALDASIERNALCDTIDICGAEKRLCIRDEAGVGDVSDDSDYARFGFAELVAHLEGVIADKRPADLDPALDYVYTLYPAYECASTFACAIGNAELSGAPEPGDADGDDIDDAVDVCPSVFDPRQADSDGDGVGDACDDCPWAVDTCPCPVPLVDDGDDDGVNSGRDNCPEVANPDQADGDGDGIGDLCDLCPAVANGDGAPCPTTIPQIKRARPLPIGEPVRVEGVVTAVASDNSGFFLEAIEGDDRAAGGYGIFVWLGGGETPARGDRVAVTGAVGVYFDQVQLTAVRSIAPVEPAVELPPPVEPGAAGLTAANAAYEGQRVCVREVAVVEVELPPGAAEDAPTHEIRVADEDGGAVRVDDFFYRIEPEPRVGDRFAAICGIWRRANDHDQIEPRDADDIEAGPPLVAGWSAETAFIRIGAPGTPRGLDGEPLSVVLTGATAEDRTVEVEGGEGLEVIEPVVVEAGADRVAVAVDPRRVGAWPLTAYTIERPGLRVAATVRVLGVDEGPSALAAEPPMLRLVRGEPATLALTLDLPPAAALPVELTIEPAIATGPAAPAFAPGIARLEVPIDPLAVGVATLTARAGGLEVEVPIEVVDPDPVISEVDYDMPNPELYEFIEVHNPGAVPIALAGVVLELVNGNNDSPYDAFPLDAHAAELPPGGFLVVGDPDVGALMPPEAIFVAWDRGGVVGSGLQNGPDEVRLLRGALEIDSVIYPDDAEDSDLDGEAIARCPTADGAWTLRPATPGALNDCP